MIWTYIYGGITFGLFIWGVTIHGADNERVPTGAWVAIAVFTIFWPVTIIVTVASAAYILTWKVKKAS